MHVIQETRRLSDECSIQNQTEKTFYGVSENEIVHLTSEILMSHNLRWVFILMPAEKRTADLLSNAVDKRTNFEKFILVPIWQI